MFQRNSKCGKRAWLSLSICAVLAFTVAFAAGCGGSDVIGDYVVQGGTDNGLVIKLSDLTDTPKFYGVTANGTSMQVIAFNYNGSYRTAFNTCQVCYGSPKAYFKTSGKNLQCQNCGNKFTLSQVGLGAPSYDCNPYPIGANDRVQTADEIIIPDYYLLQSVKLFQNWGGAQG